MRLAEFSDLGISSISEILAVPGVSLARPELFAQLDDEGELPLRVSYYMPVFSLTDLDDISIHNGYNRARLRFAGVKVCVDGSTSSGSSWSIEASELDDEDFGSHYWGEDELGIIIERAEEERFSVKFHTNGDAAVQAVLNAIEHHGGILEQSHILEHVALLDPLDYMRMSDLGICASVQSGIASMGRFSDQADAWGEERLERAWNFTALEEAGISTLMGTDWPVWPNVDPLVNAWTATAGLENGFHPSYTWDSYTNHVSTCLKQKIGCLDVGCVADRTLISADPYEQETDQWGDIEILGIELAD
jgi:predicted amidohydrolase YtcJ